MCYSKVCTIAVYIFIAAASGSTSHDCVLDCNKKLTDCTLLVEGFKKHHLIGLTEEKAPRISGKILTIRIIREHDVVVYRASVLFVAPR